MEDVYKDNLHSMQKHSPRTRSLLRRNLSHLENQVKKFKDCSAGLRQIVLELEEATGTTFLTSDQRKNIDNMPHNESVTILRKALAYLIKEYENVPKIFEEEFEKKAIDLSDSIDNTNEMTKQVILQRMQLQKENKILQRIIDINQKEKKSLQACAMTLQQTQNEQIAHSEQTIKQAQETIQNLKKEIKKTNAHINDRASSNMDLIRTINAPMKKRHKDMLADFEALQEEYQRLSKYYEKEKTQHDLTRKELIHTQSEIERAKLTIQKYKDNVNKKTIKMATRTNKNMRLYVADQREEQKRKLEATKKHNKDLERQVNELEEEQAMLIPYLASIEKKLQMEMLKLPSLNDIQRRHDNEPKRALTKLNKRELDDQEMRTVKRTLSKMKVKRAKAKTAFGK